jgi:aryl-alcohol dehydrogenase-like predicted oxidoreductase
MLNLSSQPGSPHAQSLYRFFAAGGNAIHLHGEGGEEESRIAAGEWMKETGSRSKMFVCTQVCHEGWNDAAQVEIDRLTPAAIEEDIARDLDLLQTDYLDFVYFSCDGSQAPVEPLMDTLEEQRRLGRIRSFGARNWSAERINRTNSYATQRGFPGFSAIVTTELSLGQPNEPLWPGYSPFDGTLKGAVIHWNLAVFAWLTDFNQALFIPGAYDKLDDRAVRRWHSPANLEIVRRASEFGQRHQLDERQANVAFALNQPFPVVGIVTDDPSVPLDQYVAASQVHLQSNDINYLQFG